LYPFFLDYRRVARARSSIKPYHYPLSPETTKAIDSIFDELTADSGPVVRNRQLHVWGRAITVPASSPTVAKFTFQELCGSPLSSVDYLEITRVFGTVFLLDVWKMGVERKDLARRFITFIDGALHPSVFCFRKQQLMVARVACYENKVRLRPCRRAHPLIPR
jgi:protein AFG1